MTRSYLCIDLKSFYASVECVERGLDPMTTRLVVADPERSDKTICLAVSPALRAMGVKNRCRVFEIPRGIDYITAPPRMKKYIEYAADIYSIYLGYFAPEDMHVYSIDECFIDVTQYLRTYRTTPRALALRLMEDIRDKVGVRATCGIGENLYLCKVALDILAKHADDFIAELDEQSYRAQLWDHTPLTDFWRIGGGTAARLAEHGIYTMRQLAQADEELMYRLFGVDGELLIDHAHGREITTIADIKAYRPKASSIASGQVLMRDYTAKEGRVIAREMAQAVSRDLVARASVASGVTLAVGFGHGYDGGVHGAVRFAHPTSSDHVICEHVCALYERLMAGGQSVRRFSLTLSDILPEGTQPAEQLTMFADAEGELARERERRDLLRQRSMLKIQQKYGKNAILHGTNLDAVATGRERNRQIGGHKAGEE